MPQCGTDLCLEVGEVRADSNSASAEITVSPSYYAQAVVDEYQRTYGDVMYIELVRVGRQKARVRLQSRPRETNPIKWCASNYLYHAADMVRGILLRY